MPTFTETIPVNGQNWAFISPFPMATVPFPVSSSACMPVAPMPSFTPCVTASQRLAMSPQHPTSTTAWASMTREVQASSKTWK